MFSAIEPDEFLTGFLRRRQIRNAQKRRQAQLLVQFADGGGIVFFAGAHMARRARIPEIRDAGLSSANAFAKAVPPPD